MWYLSLLVIFGKGEICSPSPFNPNHLRTVDQNPVLLNRLKRLAHGGFYGFAGDEDDVFGVSRIGGFRGALDNGFERDGIVGHALGNGSKDADLNALSMADEIANGFSMPLSVRIAAPSWLLLPANPPLTLPSHLWCKLPD